MIILIAVQHTRCGYTILDRLRLLCILKLLATICLCATQHQRLNVLILSTETAYIAIIVLLWLKFTLLHGCNTFAPSASDMTSISTIQVI